MNHNFVQKEPLMSFIRTINNSVLRFSEGKNEENIYRLICSLFALLISTIGWSVLKDYRKTARNNNKKKNNNNRWIKLGCLAHLNNQVRIKGTQSDSSQYSLLTMNRLQVVGVDFMRKRKSVHIVANFGAASSLVKCQRAPVSRCDDDDDDDE